jgi:catechol-2,3-dioxygenase
LALDGYVSSDGALDHPAARGSSPFYANMKAHSIPISFALNHRVTLSLYLRDPEGNAVEVFWPTGQNVAGMYAEPFDLALLEQSDTVLLRLVDGAVSA